MTYNRMGWFVSVALSDGLGNRLFQTAALLGYAERFGHTPVLVNTFISNTNHKGADEIQRLFPTLRFEESMNVEWHTVAESSENAFTYTPFERIEGNVLLRGFFQTPHYAPSGGIQCGLLDGVNLPAFPYNCAAYLHVRRGDYLSQYTAHHRVELMEYYKRALFFFPPSATILVCSDDEEWCRNELATMLGDSRLKVVSGLGTLETLALMSRCELGGICANSTFSWWGGYFNRTVGKVIFFPDTWGYPPLPPVRDLYPSWGFTLPVQKIET